MRKTLVYCLLLALLLNCKPVQMQDHKQTNTTTTIKEVVFDTVFKIEKDSSYYRALLVCKQNKVVLQSKPKQGNGSYMPPPRVILKDNILRVDCETKKQEFYKQWKAQHKTETKEILTTKYVAVERKLTWWQKVLINLGKFSIVVIMGGVVWGILKLKNLIL